MTNRQKPYHTEIIMAEELENESNESTSLKDDVSRIVSSVAPREESDKSSGEEFVESATIQRTRLTEKDKNIIKENYDLKKEVKGLREDIEIQNRANQTLLERFNKLEATKNKSNDDSIDIFNHPIYKDLVEEHKDKLYTLRTQIRDLETRLGLTISDKIIIKSRLKQLEKGGSYNSSVKYGMFECFVCRKTLKFNDTCGSASTLDKQLTHDFDFDVLICYSCLKKGELEVQEMRRNQSYNY